jgi:hypothetical protein
MAGKKKQAPPPLAKPDQLKAFSLAAKDTDTLIALSEQVSDELGRSISGSAIIRALLRHAGMHGASWVREQLIPLIEQELNAGVKWGKPKA